MSNALLNVKNFTLGFKIESHFEIVTHALNFYIQAGEVFALVGESGGGKSMTALSIMQLLPPAARVSTQSKILLQKTDLLQQPEIGMRKIRGKKIAIIFQDAMTALNPVFTIGQQITEVLKYHFHLRSNERKKRTLDLLVEVGLTDPQRVFASYPHQLSGGMRQRCMIAMALAGEPELLIADEPTSALDVTVAAQVLALLKDLQKKRHMSVLLITHDLGAVLQIADRIAVIYHGKIIEQNTVREFFLAPQHAYSKQLLATLPKKKPQKTKLKNTQTEKPLLKIKNLKVYFPVRKGLWQRVVSFVKAVDNVSLQVARGKTLAIIGESGSGKTTLVKALLGLWPITAGKIIFRNTDITHKKTLSKERKYLQIVFQDPYSSMNPRMTIAEILEEGLLAQHKGKSAFERQKKVEEILLLVGINPDNKFRYPHEFSGGQRQRICIARCLILEPELLVCDEPTSALDASSQLQILELLQHLQQQLNLSYLIITHNFSVVEYLADEVAVMYHGKIIEQGAVSDILKHPQQAYTKRLLAAVPKLPEHF